MKTQAISLKNYSLSMTFLFAVTLSLLLSLNLYADGLRVIQERSFQTQPGKSLSLNTSSGDVIISTWDKSEVYVKVLGNKNAEEKMKFRFENSDEGIRITAKRGSWIQWLFWSNLNLKYEVKIPSNYNAYVNTSGGNVKLDGLSGTSRLETSGGDVTVFNTKGKIILSTSGGNIKIENNSGDIKASTSGGDVNVRNFSGNLNASTSGGDIRLEGRSGEVHASTSGGDIFLNYQDSNQGIYLSTTGGDIIVRVPADFSAYADLSTTGGEVTCDLPITRNGKMTSSRIKGNLNNGGKPLHCSSTGGDIRVSR